MKLMSLAFGAAIATALALPAAADQIILKFGHVGAPGSLFALSAEEFAKRANAKLGDKAEVVVFGSFVTVERALRLATSSMCPET